MIWVALPITLIGCATVRETPPVSIEPSKAFVPEPMAPSEESRSLDGRTLSSHFSPEWTLPEFDADAWPSGWIVDEASSLALRLPHRFWTEQRARWKDALTLGTEARRVLRLEQINRDAASEEELLRSAWQLAQAYQRAGLSEQARMWLDRAAESLSPSVGLARAWDQAFRLNDFVGARALLPRFSWSGDDARKAALLRQRLYLGAQRLSAVGSDEFISTEILDRDDLWAATWNGNVVRWSLTTGQLDLILPAANVTPVKLLVATGWFLYAFQDQSLLRYSKVTGTWRTFQYPAGWTGLRVQAAVAEGEESLLVAYLGQGLWRWDKGEWTLVDDAGGGPFLNALAPDGQGGYWIGTKDRGLWWWKNGWTKVDAAGPSPVNVSVIERDPDSNRWFVGTWGEGAWLLENGRLTPWSSERDYITTAAWSVSGPVWGSLDVGLVQGRDGERTVLGARDGIPPGGVSTLVTWQGRWIWGTMGQGWAWWSEYEDPALLR